MRTRPEPTVAPAESPAPAETPETAKTPEPTAHSGTFFKKADDLF